MSSSSLTKPFRTLEQWRLRDLEQPDFIMGAILSTTSRTILAAKTGLGKSNFVIALGMRIAAGDDFLHWQGGRPARVLYLDGEMSRRLLKQRLAAEVVRLGDEPSGFYAQSCEDIPNFKPINTREGQAAIEQIIHDIGGVDLIIFDNIMSLVSGSRIEEEPWAEMLPWIHSLTRRSIGQLWIHHTGHDEKKGYGTKTREWQMDTVMHLTQVIRPDTDVSFNLSFPKARERTPSTREDFQSVSIALVNDEWVHDAPEIRPAKRPSPTAMKYLKALLNALGGSKGKQVKHGCPAVHDYDWKLELEHLGLLDPAGQKNAQRAKFSKYREELIVAELIVHEGGYTWIWPGKSLDGIGL
jgi:hypothetical protein